MVQVARLLILCAATFALAPSAFAQAGAPAKSTASSIDPSRFGQKPADAAYGAFQRGLYLTALNLALPRARDGDAAAQTLVAEIYSRGLGVRRNEEEAARWYGEAAEQGVPEALFRTALSLIEGVHKQEDLDRAYELMGRAADEGVRLAQFNYAQMILDRDRGPDAMARAVTYYEKAAEAGLADAQYAMAQILANGAGGRPVDEAKAREYLLLAARQNFDTAQLDLATWLVEGRGGEREYEAGFGWMKRAANSGNVAAQNRLSRLYLHGLGVEPDSIEAAAWAIVARRAGLKDPAMDDLLAGLTNEERKQAIERANRLR